MGSPMKLLFTITLLLLSFTAEAGLRRFFRELLEDDGGCPRYKVSIPKFVDDREIRVRSLADVEKVRAELIQFVWRSQGFPARKVPAQVHVNVNWPEAQLSNLARTDLLEIQMEEGFSTKAYFFSAARPTGKLAVWHAGHSDAMGTWGGSQVIQFFLDRGYDVLSFNMPLIGTSLPSELDKAICINHHDKIFDLERPELPYHPMKFFLEPVAVGLNHARSLKSYSRTVMIGLSGGGWTTTLYAAIDPSIQYSIPVAGSIPLYMRKLPRDLGDREQYWGPFYSIAGYPDLYTLGSVGLGRKQVQVHIKGDSCCFDVSTEPDYVARVKDRVQTIAGGNGSYDWFLDTSNPLHQVSPNTIASVLAKVLVD